MTQNMLKLMGRTSALLLILTLGYHISYGSSECDTAKYNLLFALAEKIDKVHGAFYEIYIDDQEFPVTISSGPFGLAVQSDSLCACAHINQEYEKRVIEKLDPKIKILRGSGLLFFLDWTRSISDSAGDGKFISFALIQRPMETGEFLNAQLRGYSNQIIHIPIFIVRYDDDQSNQETYIYEIKLNDGNVESIEMTLKLNGTRNCYR